MEKAHNLLQTFKTIFNLEYKSSFVYFRRHICVGGPNYLNHLLYSLLFISLFRSEAEWKVGQLMYNVCLSHTFHMSLIILTTLIKRMCGGPWLGFLTSHMKISSFCDQSQNLMYPRVCILGYETCNQASNVS